MSISLVPPEYCCPITLEIMIDPVICEDGFTYERKSIENLQSNISPLTREPINKTNLISNKILKLLINKYLLAKNKDNETISSTPDCKILEQNCKIVETNKDNEIMPSAPDYKILEQNCKIVETNKDSHNHNDNHNENNENKGKKDIKQLLQRNQIISEYNKKLGNYTLEGSYLFYYHNCGYKYVLSRDRTQIHVCFSANFVDTIQNEQKNMLLKTYTTLYNDILWIEKYVYGLSSFEVPFVNFVFDHCPEMIKEIIELIDQVETQHLMCRRSKSFLFGYKCNHLKRLKRLYAIKGELLKFSNLNQSRDYYHTHYKELTNVLCGRSFDLDKDVVKLSINQHLHPHTIYNTNMHTDWDCEFNEKYKINDEQFYKKNLYQIYDSYVFSKLSFLNIMYRYFKNDSDEWYLTDYFKSDANYVKFSHYLKDYQRYNFVNPSYFNKYIKIGETIIEIIKKLRPEIFI